MQKIRPISNKPHHSTRSKPQRKTFKRNLHRKTNAGSISNDTIHSVTLKPLPFVTYGLFLGNDKKLTSEKQIIKCCNDLAVSCKDELQTLSLPLGTNSPAEVFSCISDHLIASFPEMKVELQLNNIIPDRYEITLTQYFDFDNFYFVSFQFLWGLAGDSITFKRLVMTALKILQKLEVDICFNSGEEDWYIENLEQCIEEEEDNFGKHGDIKDGETFREEQNERKNEIAFYKAGEFNNIKTTWWHRAKDTWNLKRVKAKTKEQQQLLDWFNHIEKINYKWSIGNFEDKDYQMDGCIAADRIVRVPWTRETDDYMGGVVSGIEDEANNFGIEQLIFRSVLSPKCKAPEIPTEFFELLNIMNFEYNYEK